MFFSQYHNASKNIYFHTDNIIAHYFSRNIIHSWSTRLLVEFMLYEFILLLMGKCTLLPFSNHERFYYVFDDY